MKRIAIALLPFMAGLGEPAQHPGPAQPDWFPPYREVAKWADTIASDEARAVAGIDTVRVMAQRLELETRRAKARGVARQTLVDAQWANIRESMAAEDVSPDYFGNAARAMLVNLAVIEDVYGE